MQALYAVREFFRKGGDGDTVPEAFAVRPEPYGGGLTTSVAVFGSQSSELLNFRCNNRLGAHITEATGDNASVQIFSAGASPNQPSISLMTAATFLASSTPR
jgi:hypothetical protein